MRLLYETLEPCITADGNLMFSVDAPEHPQMMLIVPQELLESDKPIRISISQE